MWAFYVIGVPDWPRYMQVAHAIFCGSLAIWSISTSVFLSMNTEAYVCMMKIKKATEDIKRADGEKVDS
jgi:hypothetical protein